MSEAATNNPYAPPKAVVADVTGAVAEYEAIRRDYIEHEASVRSIGTLYYLGGGLLLLAAVVMLPGLATQMSEMSVAQVVLLVMLGVLYVGLGALSILVARGLRQLKAWARITTIVLAAIGLLGFPIGTLINAYILYLLLSAKGKRIFEPDYAEIVAATPDVKYRTSIVVWLVLGLLVLLVASVFVAPLLRGS
jgi:hypothetical protein